MRLVVGGEVDYRVGQVRGEGKVGDKAKVKVIRFLKYLPVLRKIVRHGQGPTGTRGTNNSVCRTQLLNIASVLGDV